MQDNGRIVAGIGPGQRVAHGIAQITGAVGICRGPGQGFAQGAAFKAHIFTVFHEEDGAARILADRQSRGGGVGGVVQKLAQYLPPPGRTLVRTGGGKRFQNVGRQVARHGQNKLCHAFADGIGGNKAHGGIRHFTSRLKRRSCGFGRSFTRLRVRARGGKKASPWRCRPHDEKITRPASGDVKQENGGYEAGIPAQAYPPVASLRCRPVAESGFGKPAG